MQTLLGEALRAAREKLGQSQAEAAEGLGLSEKYYQRVETGRDKLSVSRIVHAANYFQTDAAKLLEASAIDRGQVNLPTNGSPRDSIAVRLAANWPEYPEETIDAIARAIGVRFEQ